MIIIQTQWIRVLLYKAISFGIVLNSNTLRFYLYLIVTVQLGPLAGIFTILVHLQDHEIIAILAGLFSSLQIYLRVVVYF